MNKRINKRLIFWVILLAGFLLIYMYYFIPGSQEPDVEVKDIPVSVEEDPDVHEAPVLPPVPEEPVEEPQSFLVAEMAADVLQSGDIIGTLEIPSIDLNIRVIADATPMNLNRAPALMKSGHVPGRIGNAIISGHRMYEYGSHFNRIDEVKIGDLIIFSDTTYRHIFLVEQITVVDPAEIWITLGDNYENRLTLFACTPIRIATHRLVVFSVLKEKHAL